MQSEPRLEDIEDYDNKESSEKRKTVIKVVVFCLIVGAIFTILKMSYNNEVDYIGTEEKPGINTTKGY
jgi:hypothetical protein